MIKNRQILIFENSYKLTNFLVKKWIEIAQKSIQERSQFTAALSGGKTPVEFYCKLSNIADFDLWKHTHIFLTDERFLSRNHKESNFFLIWNNLLNYAPMGLHQVHQIVINPKQRNLETTAADYEQHIKGFFELPEGEWPRFDLILLGIGEDGHTASLFPMEESIAEPRKFTLTVSSPRVQYERISLTMPIINQSRCVVFLVTGKRKAEIIKGILQEGKNCPASQVKPVNGELLFLLDKEAADQLSVSGPYQDVGEAIAL